MFIVKEHDIGPKNEPFFFHLIARCYNYELNDRLITAHSLFSLVMAREGALMERVAATCLITN